MSQEKPLITYGYRIDVPENNSRIFIQDMRSINDMMTKPIQVYCLVPTYDAGLSTVQLVIGFVTDRDLSKNMSYFDMLREFIMDNPMFDDIEMNMVADFYTGFEWYDENDDDDETSETSGDCESSDCTSEDCTSDEDVESDDEHVDETNDKTISYYVSKYYI